MDMMTWSLLDVIIEQRRREVADERRRCLLADEFGDEQPGAARAALGRTLVRLGLQLDPSAGETVRPARLVSAGK
jgi:hypothetical protein